MRRKNNGSLRVKGFSETLDKAENILSFLTAFLTDANISYKADMSYWPGIILTELSNTQNVFSFIKNVRKSLYWQRL